MKKLTKRNRKIYNLCIKEGRSPYEVAIMCHITPPRVYAILKQVKKEMKKEAKEGVK